MIDQDDSTLMSLVSYTCCTDICSNGSNSADSNEVLLNILTMT